MKMNKILQWNVRSFNKNKPFILKLISDEKPNIICLQETNCKPNKQIKLPGFNIASRFDRPDGVRGGGVSIFTARNLPTVDFPLSTPLEACATKIFINDNPLVIISLYLPPILNNLNISTELTNLICNINYPFILCTDGNGHHPLWGSDSSNHRGDLLQDWMLNENLILLNNKNPTYETSRGVFTHIDLTFSSSINPINLNWYTYHVNLHSDHFPIFIDMPQSTPLSHNNDTKYNLKLADWNKYNSILNLPLAPYSNIDSLGDSLVSSITEAASKSIPISSKTYDPNFSKSWWNYDCFVAKKNKIKAFRAYKRNLGDDAKWLNYKRFKAIFINTVLKAKNKDFSDFLSSIKSKAPSNKFWRKIKNLKTKISNPEIVIKSNNIFLTNRKLVANALAEDFSSRGCNNSPDMTNSPPPLFDYNQNHNYNTNFNITELNRALINNSSNTPGPDNIPPALINKLNDTNRKKLLNILNFFWNNGIPNSWKISNIIPLLKPSKPPNNTSSYRPISLTNYLCKTLERLATIRLRFFLESKNKINKFQFGFRSGISTTDAICLLENSIRENAFFGRATIAIFLDISQAFDSVCHEALLYKLNKLGIEGNLLHFIKNFLSNRKIKVKNSNTYSNYYPITKGVPQGSVISPILFTTLLDDLLSPEQDIKYAIYADDVAVWSSNSNLNIIFEKLQLTLNKIEAWSLKWGLTFSPEKNQGYRIH